MFEQHFGLRENPFHSGHQMKFLYPSREHQEARAHLRYGIENREPFVLITGEVGTGKTTALYDALSEWGSKVSVALVTNSALTREEMIEEISLRFGLPLPNGTSKPQALAQLERHLLSVRNRGEHAVLLLDEAQNLAADLLEEIRLLSNLEAQGEKLVQIFLVGQPELEAKLADPQLRQLRQRISVHYRLNPLSPEETAGYIHHRISVAGGNPWATFPPEACREVYRVTHGIPREINSVATAAMITAYTEAEQSVTPAHVQAAARENDFRSVLGGPAQIADNDIPMPAPPQPEQELAPPPVAPPMRVAVPPPAAPALPPVIEITPEATTAPAWSPPELEPAHTPAPPVDPARFVAPVTPLGPHAPSGPSRIEPVQREELDAWARAAEDLMQARRTSTPAAEPVAVVSTSPVVPDEPRFPSREELQSRGAHADPGNTDLSGLPDRLRRKIEDDIAREERVHRTAPIVLGAVALVAVLVGVVLAQRFQLINVPFLRPIAGMRSESKPAPAPTTEPVALALPVSRARTLDSAGAMNDSTAVAKVAPPATEPAKKIEAPSAPALKPAATAAVATPAAARPAAASPKTELENNSAKPEAPLAAPKPATAAPKPAKQVASGADSPLYGVGVASYLDEDRAAQERDRLTALSGLPGQVLPFNNAGTTMFRVLLGRYPTNAAATRAASEFVAKYGVDEAQPQIISRGRAH